MAVAEYQVIVHWGNPEEIDIGTFETDLDGWVPQSGVYLDRSLEQVHSGKYSMKVANETGTTMIFGNPATPFGTGTFGYSDSPAVGLAATRVITGLDVGTAYTVQCWAYVPAGARHVRLTTSGADYDTTTTVTDAWLYLETSFTAGSTSKTIELYSVTTPGTITLAPYIDDVLYKEAGEDITCLVYNEGGISTNEGRDIPRALASVAPAETSFSFTNLNRLYSPNNPASVLYDITATNSPVQIRALFEGRFYILYNGFLDDFVIEQTQPDLSIISISAIDVIGKLASTTISTQLYQNIRTGEAIGIVLDEAGWPSGKRKLDYGSTVLDWWWEDNVNALEAVNKLIRAEGMPAIVYTDDVGDFVFKDRHHRYISPFSLESVAHFDECDGAAE